MTINEAIYKMSYGIKVRHENFAAGTFCYMHTNGSIEDPELGLISEENFRKEYAYFDNNWFVYA